MRLPCKAIVRPCVFLLWLLLLLCSCGKPQNPLTAEEYYHYLLQKEGYSYRREASDSEIRSLARRFRRAYPHLTEDELYERLKKRVPFSNPGEKLRPLLTDILSNLPPGCDTILSDVYAGEFPLEEINASVLAPGGGILILLNWGLVKAFHEWAKLIVNIAFGELAPEFGLDAELKSPVALLKESMREYIDNGEIPAFPMYATDQKAVLSAVLGAAAAQFVLAHECAHAILGHLENDEVSLVDEVEADRVAVEILLHNADLRPDALQDSTRIFDIQMKLAGVYYCLIVCEVSELLRAGSHDMNGSYPNFLIRFGSMKKHLQQRLGDLSKYRLFDRINYALNVAVESLVADSPKTEDLPDDLRTMKSYYVAYKSGNTARMLDLVSQNPDVFTEQVRELLDVALMFADGNFQDAVFDWSEGDFLDSAELFRLALAINRSYGRKMQRDTTHYILSKGREITRALRESAKIFESRSSFDASRHKLIQAEKIGEMIERSERAVTGAKP
ncbi:hypothetical protein E3J62_11120 [candidate division TA06 bacterium]|uniref:Uncharacterized protein n=1 Tax=candidate division TA06 bacterium TaxID=2250710 RepID=A0A523UNS6_UNCT6|nr:MAG: hypothetical protein E3J62_11120 [candidate division TA06 bacterium]